jgi:hypothetical protein
MKPGFTTSIQRPNDKAWNGITPHRPKRRSRKLPSAGKVIGTVFWDSEGCILVDFLEKGQRSMQLATFRRSANFVVHFVKNVRGRKLLSFNMTTRGLTVHV